MNEPPVFAAALRGGTVDFLEPTGLNGLGAAVTVYVFSLSEEPMEKRGLVLSDMIGDEGP